MKPKQPAYVLESGRLFRPPNVATRERSMKLIGDFVKKYAKDDAIMWHKEAVAARSGLVIHETDHTLRIDLQAPPPGWANFQLQAGKHSLACVLMECDRVYRSADVNDAWLASLRATCNARMKWRYQPSPIELGVLNSLNAREPSSVNTIMEAMRHGTGTFAIDFESHFLYLNNEIVQALKVLEANGLASREGLGWVLTPSGITYS